MRTSPQFMVAITKPINRGHRKYVARLGFALIKAGFYVAHTVGITSVSVEE